MSEYWFTSFCVQSWLYRDRRKPEPGTMHPPYLYSAQYNRQHSALQVFEEFGALYIIHNLDDKNPNRSGFEHFEF